MDDADDGAADLKVVGPGGHRGVAGDGLAVGEAVCGVGGECGEFVNRRIEGHAEVPTKDVHALLASAGVLVR